MRAEKDLQKLEDEINALKVSFEQSASMLSLFSYSDTITTTSNQYSLSNSSVFNPLEWEDLFGYLADGGTSFVGPYYGFETIRVTFRSENGSNALAHLELEDMSVGDSNVLKIMRVNFSGGARWRIDCAPNVELISGSGGKYTWSPTSLKITVRSIVPGSLEVVQL